MNTKAVLLVTLGVFSVVLLFGANSAAQVTRHYYIAAENVNWEYAPSGRDLIHSSLIPKPWTNFTRWKKTRYVEYTDGTFTAPKAQPPWLGVLGPIIRAEVGDTIQVHFVNRADGSFGIHPHGVRYTKDNEGAHYFGFDGTAPGAGAQVAPGGSFTYTWIADDDSGPGPSDPNSIVWWYHSHVDEPQETNAGLLGPIIITRKGMANADATPKDVNREFVTMFMIFDEAAGAERGLMHSINGFIFGNLPGLVMNLGEKVRWYLLGMGNEIDLHSGHWHGKTVRFHGRQTDVIELLPGSMATVDMNADNAGTWLYHCHVADHIDAGMIATYTIQP
ncbi:MAG: multicopper oxidase domain-containing protein [Acidobacteria bacterium]|nr:multicopper oxidase domain-containing protein [Acidobacteriota bacterium]